MADDQSLAGVPDPKDPLLDAMVDQMEAALPASQKRAYQQIVVAGMKVMFSKETSYLLDKVLEQGDNLPQSIVKGVLNLLATIYKQSGGKMSVGMAIPAGITLLCYALDYAKKSRGIQITKPMLAEMIKLLTKDGLQMLGMDEQKFAKGIEYARDHQQEFEESGEFPEPGQQQAATPAASPAAPGMVGGM